MPSPLLTTALAAAREAEAVIRHYYASNVAVDLKADKTPVTVADVETEHAIKAVIRAAFPDHGFLGEETGADDGDAEYLWLVDPIDGTKAFVRGRPFFSTQIALKHRDRFILGVSNAPIYGELAWAEAGGGAFLNDQPIRVSDITELDQAVLSGGNLKSLTRDAGSWARYGELIRRVNGTRGFGDFLHYHLLAAGKLDVVVESDVNILDIAALSVIVTEAGGHFTDLAGGPLTLDTTTVLASNGRLHQAVRQVLEA